MNRTALRLKTLYASKGSSWEDPYPVRVLDLESAWSQRLGPLHGREKYQRTTTWRSSYDGDTYTSSGILVVFGNVASGQEQAGRIAALPVLELPATPEVPEGQMVPREHVAALSAAVERYEAELPEGLHLTVLPSAFFREEWEQRAPERSPAGERRERDRQEHQEVTRSLQEAQARIGELAARNDVDAVRIEGGRWSVAASDLLHLLQCHPGGGR